MSGPVTPAPSQVHRPITLKEGKRLSALRVARKLSPMETSRLVQAIARYGWPALRRGLKNAAVYAIAQEANHDV